jgi:SSS family solute:Na+ symporter
MGIADYIIIGVFLAAVFAMGSYFYRWIGKPDDFYVASRKLTPFILAATLTATNVNLYSFVGQSGVAYKHGISIVWHTWTGNMALVFSGLFVIPILRRLKIRTIPEFLSLRYNKSIRILVGFLWVFRLSFWLGVVLYTGVVAAQAITGIQSYTFWVLVISLIVIIYTYLGGMWSIALMDVVQFIFMMIGALIILPMAMRVIGWWPGLVSGLPSSHLQLITKTGPYNWAFVIAIWILGIEWACVDQGLLQRAFSAETTKSVAKGLVFAGIIATPFALLWYIPGLAASVISPGLANPDSAIPTLITQLLPTVVFGFVVLGLIGSQMSTIDSNLGAAATLFTNDIYTRILKREPTQKEVLRVVRIATICIGIFMMGFSYLIPKLGGAVNAYLTVIGIMDMPLFIIAIVYGLLWKRATWQGAIAGYFAGAIAGAIVRFPMGMGVPPATFASAGAALLICPLVSILTTRPSEEKIRNVFKAKVSSDEEIERGEVYHIIPVSKWGRISLGIFGLGLILFLTGTIMGSQALRMASLVAAIGMVIYFLGGFLRIRFD